MVAFIYRCPTIGLNVQGWVADGGDTQTKDDAYQPLTCLACRRTHLVNPITRKVLSGNND